MTAVVEERQEKQRLATDSWDDYDWEAASQRPSMEKMEEGEKAAKVAENREVGKESSATRKKKEAKNCYVMLGCGRHKYSPRDDGKSIKSILGDVGVIRNSEEENNTPIETSLTTCGSGEDVGEGVSDTDQYREQGVGEMDGQIEDDADRSLTRKEAIHTGMIRVTPSNLDNLTSHMARIQEQDSEQMTGDGVTDEGRSKRRKFEDIANFTIDSNQVQDNTDITPAVSTSIVLAVSTSPTVAGSGTSVAVHTVGSNTSTKYPAATSPQNSSAQTRSQAASASAHTTSIFSAPKPEDVELKLDWSDGDNDDDNDEADVDTTKSTQLDLPTQLDLSTAYVPSSSVPHTASHSCRPVVTPSASSGSCVLAAPPTTPSVASPLYPLSGGRVSFTMKGLGEFIPRGQAIFSVSMRPNVVLEKAMAAFGEKFGVDHKHLEFSCRSEVLTGDQLVSHVVGRMVLVRSKKGTGEQEIAEV